MSPTLQAFYRLWHCPGQVMDPAWWAHTGLDRWRFTYERYPLTRPDLDCLLRQQLTLEGKPPVLTPLTEELMQEERRETLLLALGLWAMKGGALLLLRPYRESLAKRLDGLTLGQLQALLPIGPLPEIDPKALPETAIGLGTAWLANTQDPALRSCRLLLAPGEQSPPGECPLPVLQKLLRWL